ncbi:HisA/HisF-related TIM barrel protein [Rubripirellula amarantea]|nr:HisA/HisF-related TIM barrel protein [Rubripirellula amarantea]
MSSHNLCSHTDRLVGVIDLKAGQAVHAVRGERTCYEAVKFCNGDAAILAAHYASVGIRRLYIADLDGICHDSVSERDIEGTAAEFVRNCNGQPLEILVDIGWNDSIVAEDINRIVRLNETYPSMRWIAATETMLNKESLRRLTETIAADECVLSLDYRGGILQSRQDDEPTWIETAKRLGLREIIVLDLHAVGAKSGVCTAEICHRVKKRFPHSKLFSGGGVRHSDDVDVLTTAGCDYVLVATALHPQP